MIDVSLHNCKSVEVFVGAKTNCIRLIVRRSDGNKEAPVSIGLFDLPPRAKRALVDALQNGIEEAHCLECRAEEVAPPPEAA